MAVRSAPIADPLESASRSAAAETYFFIGDPSCHLAKANAGGELAANWR